MDPDMPHPKLRELLTLCEVWGSVHPLVDFFKIFRMT